MQLQVFLTLVFLTMMSLSSLAQPQELEYKIVWRNDSVGHLQVFRYDSSGFDIHRIESAVQIWLFGTKDIRYSYFSQFKNGKLLNATTLYTKNDQVKAESSVTWTKTGYEIIVDGEPTDDEGIDIIENSVTPIYLTEPKSRNKLFSERFGRYLVVEELAPHHYSLEKPDGRPTEYEFKNGICSRVIIDNFFATFYFERIR